MSNRYLIYSMLGYQVEVILPNRCKPLSGVISCMCRDVFTGNVVFEIAGRLVELREPTRIVAAGGEVVFLYGDVAEEDDEAFFQGAAEAFGESVHEYARRTARGVSRTARFRLGKKVRRKRVFSK